MMGSRSKICFYGFIVKSYGMFWISPVGVSILAFHGMWLRLNCETNKVACPCVILTKLGGCQSSLLSIKES